MAYNQAAVDKFLTPPSDASPLVIKIINNLKIKERQKPFLSSLIAVSGTAVWNKCVSNQPNVGITTRDNLLKTNSELKRISSVGSANTDFIFIPLIDSVTLEVKTILQCYVKNDTSFTYRVINKAAIIRSHPTKLSEVIGAKITISLFAAFERKISPDRKIIFPSPFNMEIANPYFGLYTDNIKTTVSTNQYLLDKKVLTVAQNGDVYYIEVDGWRIYYIYHGSINVWTILHVAQVEDVQPGSGGGGSPSYVPTFYPDPIPTYDPGSYSSNPEIWLGAASVYPHEWILQAPGESPFTQPGPGEFQELPPDPNFVPYGLNDDDALNYILFGLKNNPLALIGSDNIPPALKEQWIALASFTVSQSLKTRLDSLVAAVGIAATGGTFPGLSILTLKDVAKVQNIANASSSVVNMDYFPVVVTTLPTINYHQLTPDELLSMIRKNMNNFVDSTKTGFKPYNYYGIDDRNLWQSNNPNGAIMDLSIPFDHGSVITTFDPMASNKWIFTTIHDPQNGDHPVSGNREFGYTANTDGTYTFFTKGVDRLTNLSGAFLQSITGTPFHKADELWYSFQSGIFNFIDHYGGSSYVAAPTILRPDWDVVRSVMNRSLPLSSLGQ